MPPGCHSAMHVMVCEHSVDRLVAVSSCAPSPTPHTGNCLPEEDPAPLPEPWAGQAAPTVRAGSGHVQKGCAIWRDPPGLLNWKKSLITCNCNSAKLIAQPDFHGDRKGCFPAKFQVAFLKSKATGYARKGICQISPAFLFFFFFILLFFKTNHILGTSESSEMLS